MALPSPDFFIPGRGNDVDRTYLLESEQIFLRPLPNDYFRDFALSHVEGTFRISRKGKRITYYCTSSEITRHMVLDEVFFENHGWQRGWQIVPFMVDKRTLKLRWNNYEIQAHRAATYRFHNFGSLRIEFESVYPEARLPIRCSVNMKQIFFRATPEID